MEDHKTFRQPIHNPSAEHRNFVPFEGQRRDDGVENILWVMPYLNWAIQQGIIPRLPEHL